MPRNIQHQPAPGEPRLIVNVNGGNAHPSLARSGELEKRFHTPQDSGRGLGPKCRAALRNFKLISLVLA